MLNGCVNSILRPTKTGKCFMSPKTADNFQFAKNFLFRANQIVGCHRFWICIQRRHTDNVPRHAKHWNIAMAGVRFSAYQHEISKSGYYIDLPKILFWICNHLLLAEKKFFCPTADARSPMMCTSKFGPDFKKLIFNSFSIKFYFNNNVISKVNAISEETRWYRNDVKAVSIPQSRKSSQYTMMT